MSKRGGESAGEHATSALGVMAAKAWWRAVLAVAAPGVALAIMGVLYPTKNIPGGTIKTAYLQVGLVTLGLALVLAILVVLARASVRRGVERERAWVSSLPFALEGQLQFYESGYGAFELRFAGTAPDRETLAPIVERIASSPLVLDDHQIPRIKIDRIRSSERQRWRELHRLVGTLLVPLHARYPLEAVRFS